MLAVVCGVVGPASAQLIVLDNFSAAGATGGAIGSTWVGNVTRNVDSITVGGNARDENGWGAALPVAINATGMNFITVTAQRDAGNTAPSLVIQLIDAGLQTQIFSVSTAAFAQGGLTLLEIPIGSWDAGFNPTQITRWTIGGGTTGLVPFRMTLENLALSATTLPARHSADTDANFRLGLTELTRVMELYRTANAGGRTGCYDVATGTEDRFAPAPTRADAPAVLTAYHSSDYNRDGRVDLTELTRVLEIYNHREGTVRTGRYRVQATGTVDGFAPGP